MTRQSTHLKGQEKVYIIPHQGKRTICYSARRFKCPKYCNTFYEDNPFESQYCGIFDTTVLNALKKLKDYNQIFTSVVRKLNITKSECMKIFDEHIHISHKQLSECVAMDKFNFSRHAKRKYRFRILSKFKDNKKSDEYYLLKYRKRPSLGRSRVQYLERCQKESSFQIQDIRKTNAGNDSGDSSRFK